ncbi:hypothetical protein [Aliiroseovarius sp. F20344]|uniref:hypothetical protein n=1 Tax=Aliiroseovarius sp. F20344 TaxID=2926414 RepID=UPI001FF26EB4|nr:hypothetical protein [Aliiroseovarius sp. F20344]MCK0143345.1 hypothetical protein [Aliiroseovarius sp. F20344]
MVRPRAKEKQFTCCVADATGDEWFEVWFNNSLKDSSTPEVHVSNDLLVYAANKRGVVALIDLSSMGLPGLTANRQARSIEGASSRLVWGTHHMFRIAVSFVFHSDWQGALDSNRDTSVWKRLVSNDRQRTTNLQKMIRDGFTYMNMSLLNENDEVATFVEALWTEDGWINSREVQPC